MKKQLLFICATALPLLLTLNPALADIQVPTEPPSQQQVQQPQADKPAAGPALPAAATVVAGEGGDAAQAETPADLAAFIKDLLDKAIAGNAAVVTVNAAPADAAPIGDIPPGGAKNVAEEPPKPQLTVSAVIGKRLVKPMVGEAYAPVEVTVTRDGKPAAKEKFEIIPASRDKAAPALTAFIAKHLPAAQPAAAAAAVGPQLKLWLESSDGAAVKLGSQVAVYWQATKDGYVSLYHFGSSGTVERVFPSAQLPENFVQAGRTYRFPATGFLTFRGKPGQETFRAVITTYPSNTPREQPGGLAFKGEPLRVIPTHYPMLFANQDLSRVFALPPQQFGETHLTYTLQAK